VVCAVKRAYQQNPRIMEYLLRANRPLSKQLSKAGTDKRDHYDTNYSSVTGALGYAATSCLWRSTFERLFCGASAFA
jgi:hypothetical protein